MNEYTKALIEMAKQCDYKLIENFMVEHKEHFPPRIVGAFGRASVKTKKLTYIRLVESISDKNKTQEMKDYAKRLKAEVYTQ